MLNWQRDGGKIEGKSEKDRVKVRGHEESFFRVKKWRCKRYVDMMEDAVEDAGGDNENAPFLPRF